jgi:hypothetical protein
LDEGWIIHVPSPTAIHSFEAGWAGCHIPKMIIILGGILFPEAREDEFDVCTRILSQVNRGGSVQESRFKSVSKMAGHLSSPPASMVSHLNADRD